MKLKQKAQLILIIGVGVLIAISIIIFGCEIQDIQADPWFHNIAVGCYVLIAYGWGALSVLRIKEGDEEED